MHALTYHACAGISEEMKEAGRPRDVKENERSTHSHLYSEKIRFDTGHFANAERAGASMAAAAPGDTGPDRAVHSAAPAPAGTGPSKPKPDPPDETAPGLDEDTKGREGGEGGPGPIEKPAAKKAGPKEAERGKKPGPDPQTAVTNDGEDRHVMDYSR